MLPSEARLAGWRLWDALQTASDLPVVALFWAQFSENANDWRIYLASPVADVEGKGAVYDRLQRVIGQIPADDLYGLELADIAVVGTGDRTVREMKRRYGPMIGDRRTVRRLALSAEEAYVYFLA
jgi:hypothetical protein